MLLCPLDIEEMTQKTGNFKKFAVFIRMLSTAFSRSSESVYIDLLTPADLEMLKARKLKGAQSQHPDQPSPASAAANHNKRYLILTYVVEFDRYDTAAYSLR